MRLIDAYLWTAFINFFLLNSFWLYIIDRIPKRVSPDFTDGTAKVEMTPVAGTTNEAYTMYKS